MPETPKQKDTPFEPVEKDRSSWSEDQQKRGYYYDDAHGYETYDPAADNEEESENSSSGSLDLDLDLDRPPTLLIEPQKAE